MTRIKVFKGPFSTSFMDGNRRKFYIAAVSFHHFADGSAIRPLGFAVQQSF